MVEMEDISSHKQHSSDRLHIHTMKGSTSLKLWHAEPVKNAPLKPPLEFISPQCCNCQSLSLPHGDKLVSGEKQPKGKDIKIAICCWIIAEYRICNMEAKNIFLFTDYTQDKFLFTLSVEQTQLICGLPRKK